MAMMKILIVEDDAFIYEIIARELAKAGYEIKGAYDGEQALVLASAEKPDLILLDLLIPKKNGFEVLEALKANPELAKVPVIVLSNLGQQKDIDRAMNIGAATFLVKVNFTPQDVLAKIESVLKRPV